MRLEINCEPAKFLPPNKTGASRAKVRADEVAASGDGKPTPSGREQPTHPPDVRTVSQFEQTGASGTPAWGNLDRVSQRRQRPKTDRHQPAPPIPDTTRKSAGSAGGSTLTIPGHSKRAFNEARTTEQ